MGTYSRPCPVGCGRIVHRPSLLMCRPCWGNVPAQLQAEVMRTYRAYLKATPGDGAARAYLAARDAAITAAGL